MERIRVDVAIHIPEGHRLSIHGMSGLMNMDTKCLYKLDDNMCVICESDIFNSLDSGGYNVVGLEYDGHMYEYDAPVDPYQDVILEPMDMWDEYTEYVELSI